MDTQPPSPEPHPLPGPAHARWWILTPLVLLLACGTATSGDPDAGTDPDTELPDAGDGDPDGEDTDLPPTRPVETREDQLRELGFDVKGIEATPRKLDAEVTLGEAFSPIGTIARLAPHELAMVGMGGSCADLDDTSALRVLGVEIFHQENGRWGTAGAPAVSCVANEEGNFKPTQSTPQAHLEDPGTQSTRTLTTGDFDGDGLDEGLVLNGLKHGSIWEVHTKQFEHGVSAPAPKTSYIVLGADPVLDTAAVSGEFNGDAREDALLAMIQGSRLVLLPLLQDGDGNLRHDAPVDANVHELTGLSGILSVTMASGNLDTDHQHEVVVVVRAFGPKDASGQPVAEVRTFVFDNLPEQGFSFPLLRTETLTYTDPDFGPDQNVKVADVAIADFDGDGLDEIAFTGIGRFYNPITHPDGCGSDYTYVTRIMDDLAHGGEVIDTRVDKANARNCSSLGYGAGAIYERFARAMEYDGAPPRELLVNHQLYRLEEGSLVEVMNGANIPSPVVWEFIYQNDPYAVFSEANATVVAAETSGDGRDEVITYNTYDKIVRITGKGVSAGEPDFYKQVVLNTDGAHPQIVPLNSDDDGSVVRFIPGSHRVMLSEPLVQAVLASPPYSEEWGQSGAQSVTSYSTSQSTGTSHESTLTTRVGASVAVNFEFGLFEILSFGVGFGAEFEQSVTVGQGSAYTLTRTESFEAEGEDAVVFTAVPYDVYDYRILRTREPGMEGKTLSIMLPRTPVTRVVSRKYFNDRVPEDGLKIGEDLLPHVVGEPRSYMTLAEKRELSERVRLDGQPFIQSELQTIGEGNTSTTISVEVSKDSFHSKGYGKSSTFSVEFTGGVVTTNFSMGQDEENTMVTTYGETTAVEASIPSITVDDTEHPDAVYSFGIFTYMKPPKNGSQSFQVINYWVE